MVTKKEWHKVLVDWAQKVKEHTDTGVLLFWNDEICRNPVWKINKRQISFTSGNSTIHFEDIENEKDLNDVKERMVLATIIRV